MWKRYGHYVLGTALLIVLATALYNGWRSYKIDSEQRATSAVMAIVNDGKLDDGKKIEKLTQFAQTNKKVAQSFMARFDAAALALKNDQTAKAVEIYDNVAADTTVETPFRQFAVMLSVQAQMDKGDPKELQTRLQDLITDSPWKTTAKELSAYLALKMGDRTKARALFSELATESDVPSSIALRSKDMVRWLDDVTKTEAK
jgi:hypothetical protein